MNTDDAMLQPVLTDAEDATDLEAEGAMPHCSRIVDSTVIPHTAFKKAHGRIVMCYRWADLKADPHCLLILGESRTGKSTVTETFYLQHLPQRRPGGIYMPVLRVKVPPKPTVKSFVTELLIACGDPAYNTGNENSKTVRLKALMRAMKTRMVLIDEFNHFYDKGQHSVAYHVADWLKTLIDDTRASVVGAGIPVAAAILEQNEQLLGRFLKPIFMPRFDWTNDVLREEFVAILEAFFSELAREFELPELHSIEMAFRCYCATGGLVGLLAKFLAMAEMEARAEGRNVITLAHLEDALDVTVWRKEGTDLICNPFDRGFIPVPTEDLLRKVRRLGVPEKPPAQPKRRSRAIQPQTLKDALT